MPCFFVRTPASSHRRGSERVAAPVLFLLAAVAALVETRKLDRGAHELADRHQLVPNGFRRPFAVQVHDGDVLLPQPLEGLLVVLVVRPYPGQGGFEVVVLPPGLPLHDALH